MCVGQHEPRHAKERLWLYARMVCRYESALKHSTRTDLAEFENAPLRIEIRTLKAARTALEREYMEILSYAWSVERTSSDPLATLCG